MPTCVRLSARRGPFVAAALIVVPMVLGGCADASSGPGQQASPGPSPSPSGMSSSTVSPGPVPVLRIGDDGAEVELLVGRTAVVFLPATYTWTEPVVDGHAVTITRDVSDEGGSSRSWTVTARHPGTANIALTGSPTCRSETPSCAAPDVSWTAAFTVR